MEGTRKNFYAKYSARMILGLHLMMNMSMLPTVLIPNTWPGMDETQAYNSKAFSAQVKHALSARTEPLRSRAHRSPRDCCSDRPPLPLPLPLHLPSLPSPRLQMLKGLNSLKFVMGMYMLAENVGVTLLEPLLAALPKPLQRLRVGPLASPGKYSSRDWALSLMLLSAFMFPYSLLCYKNIFWCGWSPNEFPWNLPDYPNGFEWFPNYVEGGKKCDELPQTMIEFNLLPQNLGFQTLFPLILILVSMVLIPCGLLRLSRKLAGWEKPPASGEEAAAEASSAAQPPAVARV